MIRVRLGSGRLGEAVKTLGRPQRITAQGGQIRAEALGFRIEA